MAKTRSYKWEALYAPSNVYLGDNDEIAIEMSAVYSRDSWSRKRRDKSKHPRYKKKTRYLVGDLGVLKEALSVLDFSEEENFFPSLEDGTPLVYVARVPLGAFDKQGYRFGGNAFIEKIKEMLPKEGQHIMHGGSVKAHIQGWWIRHYLNTNHIDENGSAWRLEPRGFYSRSARVVDLERSMGDVKEKFGADEHIRLEVNDSPVAVSFKYIFFPESRRRHNPLALVLPPLGVALDILTIYVSVPNYMVWQSMERPRPAPWTAHLYEDLE